MVTVREYECGCRITSKKHFSSIDYCPLHKSAPDLYEALEKIITAEDEGFEVLGYGRSQNARKAIAKAEGKSKGK